MRRPSIFGVFISILIAGCTLVPVQAAEVHLQPKSDYEAAIARIDEFVSYAQTYAPLNQYFQEYNYLESLALKTSNLVDHYDDSAFTLHNAEAYNTAITAIDQAIESCRYVFGIVRAENPTASVSETTQSTSVSSASTPATISTAVAQSQTPSAQLAPTTTLAVATDTAPQSDSQSDDQASITTFQATETEDSTTDEELPAEVPKTGGISQSSSILFIVIMSFVAAIAATGIYFASNHQSKPTIPAARRKRR